MCLLYQCRYLILSVISFPAETRPRFHAFFLTNSCSAVQMEASGAVVMIQQDRYDGMVLFVPLLVYNLFAIHVDAPSHTQI